MGFPKERKASRALRNSSSWATPPLAASGLRSTKRMAGSLAASCRARRASRTPTEDIVALMPARLNWGAGWLLVCSESVKSSILISRTAPLLGMVGVVPPMAAILPSITRKKTKRMILSTIRAQITANMVLTNSFIYFISSVVLFQSRVL